ncbi:MAG: alpha-2-macroglobulin family protein, partial [Tabrizicola sp.]|nr:alpha-2-macroglobulin family protein [Tabrizicola sp.]
TATTDDQGYAMFDAGLTRGLGGSAPAMVVVRDGESDLAFLSLTDPEFDLSDRGVEGREAAPPVDVFLTTDRGAYRAGETVYVTALSRDAEQVAVEGLPLTAILSRPDGVEYSRQLVEDQGAGGHVFSLPIAGSAPRGVWRLEMYADLEAPALAAKTFLVEDFLPERIDFELTMGDEPLSLGTDVAPELSLAAEYLFGAPGAGLAIEGEVLLSAASGLEDFPGYVFGRYDLPFSAQMQSLDPAETDEGGNALVPVYLPVIDEPYRPLEARVTVRVAEGSGRPVERSLTEVLAPAAPMIGVKPLFDWVVPEGTEARFQLVAVGPDLKPADMDVAWQVVRVQYDYQWYQSYGSWSWEPIVTRTPVAEGQAKLGAEPVEVAAKLEWGNYEIVVQELGGGKAATSTEFYAGWYAPADASATPDTLELSLDKEAYKPGETATLRIVPRAAGTA